MNHNLGLIVLTLFAIVIFVFLKWGRTRKDMTLSQYESELTMDRLLSIVKTTLADLVKEESITGLTALEFENSFKRRARVNDALKRCVYGIESAKIIVIDLIRTVISEYLTDEQEVLKVVDFTSMFLEARIKFEILLYKYKKQYGKKALVQLIQKYNLNRVRYEIEDRTKPHYLVDEKDINDIYMRENIHLTYDEMLDIVAILLYQRYKGFGLVDTINEMDINGYNFGTSGSILTALSTREVNRNHRAPSSVWIYYKGIYIHFEFLNFGTEEEVRRVVQLICRYNNPGPLTEKRGFIVNTMYDKSRVLAVRPPLSEYWAVFVRKFTLDDYSTMGLLQQPGFRNVELPYMWLKFLMEGRVTTAFTGRQGSGKTTLMKAVFEFMDPRHNVRVIEMAPELYLRELYPERNILSLQETTTVTATMAQDALKKSDGAITVVGEVATDEIAANMIQAAQIASLYTIFSHHANRAEDLIHGLRNSLVNAKHYSQETAEDQVLEVIHMDVHQDYDTTGMRYVERITEIIPLAENADYPEYDPEDPVNSMNRIQREYYMRKTDRKKFISRDLIRFDIPSKTYVPVNCPSAELISKMLPNIYPEDLGAFMRFIESTWVQR